MVRALMFVVFLYCVQNALAQVNVAKETRVTASSQETTALAVGKLIDANLKSRWSSSIEKDQWIIIDMGVNSYLSSMLIKWHTDYAKAYLVSVSANASAWKVAYNVSGGLGGDVTIPLNSYHRFIKIDLIEPANTRYSIWEIEIYLNDPAPPTYEGPTITTYMVKWKPPTKRENGVSLAPKELKGYELIGLNHEGGVMFTKDIPDGKATSHSGTVPLLLGVKAIAVKAYDVNGLYSNAVTLNVTKTLPKPTNIIFTYE